MRALSWPVVARNTLTLTPGSVLANPFTTAVTVFWVTEVYRVSCCGAWSAAVDAVVDVAAELQAARPARPASRIGSAAATGRGNLMMTSVREGRRPAGRARGSSRGGGGGPGRAGPGRSGRRIQPWGGGAPWPTVLFVRGPVVRAPVVTGPFVTVLFVTGP